MVDLEKSVVARYEYKDRKFEILVDPNKALDIRRGKNIDIRDVLYYPAIYKDVRKAEVVPREDLQNVFGTTDIFKIAEIIIKRGELQLTTEQRRKMLEERKKQVAEIIARKAINPQTNLPHPPSRILNAMEQVGVNIDPFLDAELQVDKVAKEISKVIPLSFQKVLIELRIPPQFANIYGIIKNLCEIRNEEWLNDGTLLIQVEVLAGVQAELFSRLSSLTKGNFQSKILKKETV